MRVIFFNIGWMKYYSGISDDDEIVNGGSFVEDEQYGAEELNFSDYKDYCYGYVPVRGNLNMKRISGVQHDVKYVDDVLVIWCATPPDGKQRRIVGWYRNARVYSENQKLEIGSNVYTYKCYAKRVDCYLVPHNQRNFVIPTASINKGMGMGQASVWYADSIEARTEFLPKVLKYIEEFERANSCYFPDEITDDSLGALKACKSKYFTKGEITAAIQKGDTVIIAAYWTPDQIKHYNYDLLHGVQCPAKFPNNLDLLKVIIIGKKTQWIYAMSIFTEAFYKLHCDNLKPKIGFSRAVRIDSGMEFEFYEVAK